MEKIKGKEMQRLQLAALEAAANGIIIADPTGIIQWVNPAFAELTGYVANEAIGKNTSLLKSGKQDPSYYKDLWKTITSGKVWHGELINRRKDGSHYIEEQTITPVRDEHGSITHFIAIKQDITARKTAEEELKQILAKLEAQYLEVERARSETRAILDATSEAMILISPEDKFMWVNRTFEQFFSIKTNKVINHSFSDILPHFEHIFEDPSGVKARFEDEAQKENIQYNETVVQKWPQKRELEIYSVPVKNKKKTHLGQLFVFRDATHQREVERMKSEFVSLVSHELRTPLTSIRGYVDMLLEGDAGEIKEEQADFLHVIKRNTERLTILVNELLDVSRIEAGAIKLNLAPLDIATSIREVVESIRPQIESKKQTIDVILPGDLPAVMADANRITQIFTNLISNAHKYTPEEGVISVIVHLEKKNLRIDVNDTGIGLTKEEQNKLFTKFFRADNPYTQKIGGAGLGLWITRSLVEMHGGEIHVSSTHGKGSKFSLSLPLE
jgi:PAS domain S-box-containing protein